MLLIYVYEQDWERAGVGTYQANGPYYTEYLPRGSLPAGVFVRVVGK